MHADCSDADSNAGAGAAADAVAGVADGATDAVPVSSSTASSSDDHLRQQQQQQQQRKHLAETKGAVTDEGRPASLSSNGYVHDTETAIAATRAQQ